jgi:hypothetical protein
MSVSIVGKNLIPVRLVSICENSVRGFARERHVHCQRLRGYTLKGHKSPLRQEKISTFIAAQFCAIGSGDPG